MRKEKEHIKGNWTSLLAIVEDHLEKNIAFGRSKTKVS